MVKLVAVFANTSALALEEEINKFNRANKVFATQFVVTAEKYCAMVFYEVSE